MPWVSNKEVFEATLCQEVKGSVFNQHGYALYIMYMCKQEPWDCEAKGVFAHTRQIIHEASRCTGHGLEKLKFTMPEC